jgi:hypothetical protein
MFGMMGVFAKFERSMIVARVNAGMSRAKVNGTKSGKAIGRPRITRKVEQRNGRTYYSQDEGRTWTPAGGICLPCCSARSRTASSARVISKAPTGR